MLTNMERKPELRILTWNIKGLHTTDNFGNKFPKLRLPEIYNEILNYDIICIQESWCTDQEAKCMEDVNFKVYYCNRK